jgi:hypothetical protein
MASFIKRLQHWESWPFWLIYAPLSFHWLWYGLKCRHFWFFVPANPTLTFGGFEGETKKEMYSQLPDWSIPTTIFIDNAWPIEKVYDALKERKLEYPIITKPETGMQGVLFRIIDKPEQLATYHAALPEAYIIQPFIKYPVELSVFHVRYPHEDKGKITGFIMKEYMHIVGDGEKTTLQLIEEHPKARFMMEEMQHKHGKRFEHVLPNGEKYLLSFAGNHNRGARFINLYKQIDDKLLDLFARIGAHSGKFFYGRYDVKCQSIEELKEGKNFGVLEFNGAGAEPNHIYDCGFSLGRAYKEIIDHWRYLYEIGKINHKEHGAAYWSFWKGHTYLQAAKKHFKKLQAIDLRLKV